MLTVRIVDARVSEHTLALTGDVVRICPVADAKASLAALWSDGALALVDPLGKTVATEQIGVGAQAVNPYGSLTTIRQIADHLYACGMGGQVYQRIDAGIWRLISKELCSENIYERWFSNVDGLSGSHLFAAGLEGAFYFFDGYEWQKINTNTTVPLGEMTFLDGGKVYVAGAQSTLLHGHPGIGFSKIGLVSRELTLYTICYALKKVFIGTERGLFEFNPITRNMKFVDIGTDVTADILLLQSTENVMWAFGSKFVCRYDGGSWVDYGKNL